MGVREPEDEDATLAAIRAGDARAFAALAEGYRRQLQVHCYRMLCTWLYRIATNLCLNALERSPRRVLPSQVTQPASDPDAPLTTSDLPWLQPYPGHLLEDAVDRGAQPEEIVVAKETLELAFLAAVQLLPPRQRAVLILRDVVGWSAKETASMMDASIASINSALQRARAALQRELPDRDDRVASVDRTDEEVEVLRKYIEAVERNDMEAFANCCKRTRAW